MDKLIQLQQELDSDFKEIKCYLDKNDPHILAEAKILSCSNKACLECVQKFTKEDKLLCGYCDFEHNIQSIDELISYEQENYQLKLNEIEAKINRFVYELLDELKKRDTNIDNECIQAKKEITEKINQQKDICEGLHLKMRDQLSLIQNNLEIELKKLSENMKKKSLEFEIFSAKMEESFDDLNEEDLISKIFKCQNSIDNMKALEDNFFKILKKISFEPSQFRPNENFIFPSYKKFS